MPLNAEGGPGLRTFFSMPTVTALIPVYNREKLVVEALDSALQQTRPPDEILVVDDGSTDDTGKVVLKYGDRLRYLHQRNSGPAAARNHGIRAARGDFIALLDSDDLWAKDRLERQLAALARHPELDVVFGLEARFADDRVLQARSILDPDVLACLESIDCVVPEAFSLLLKENFLPTSTVLFRRRCVERIGLIDESLRQAEDYDFWLRFALSGFQFGFVNAVLCHRRQHEGNLVKDWVKMTESVSIVLSRYGQQAPAQRETVARRLGSLHYDLGSYFLYQRDFGKALQHLRQGRPPGGSRLVWAAKIAVARLFCGRPAV